MLAQARLPRPRRRRPKPRSLRLSPKRLLLLKRHEPRRPMSVSFSALVRWDAKTECFLAIGMPEAEQEQKKKMHA